jgi:hypothetical protein
VILTTISQHSIQAHYKQRRKDIDMNNFRKAVAVIAAMTLMTCSFASCGKGGDKNDTKAKSSASDSKSEKNGIEDKWYSDDKKMGFSFNSDSSVDLFMDISEQVYFSGETLYFQDTAAPAESITLNGDELSINIGGTEIMTLQKKESREGSDYYGKYVLTGGMLYTSLPETSDSIYLDLGDNLSVCSYGKVMTYTAEDGSFELIRRAEKPQDYFATFDCFDIFDKLK